METYTGRIHADPTNRYVHIRDMVSELKAYKAKPMKQVIPSTHDVTLETDQFSASSSGPSAKCAKVERMDVDQELPSIKHEYISNCLSSRPPMLHSSSKCQLTPLTAICNSTVSAGVDISDCKLMDVASDDDIDSDSSIDEGNSVQPSTVTDSHLTDDLVSSGTELSANSTIDSRFTDKVVNSETELSVVNSVSNSSVNCSNELLEPAEVKNTTELSANSTELSSKPVSSSMEQQRETSEVKRVTLQTANDTSESVAHCSSQQDERVTKGGEVKTKLPSARHIRYLETLLSV